MLESTPEDLATDFRDLLREMAASRTVFASFREELAGHRGRVETQLSILRWLGTFMAAILVTLVGSVIWLSWHVSALNQRVDTLEKTTSKILDRPDQGVGTTKPLSINH